MKKTEFVTAIRDLYSDLRDVGGSLVWDGDNRTRSGDDLPGIKPSVLLAWDLWNSASPERNAILLEKLRRYVKDAQLCRELQANPLTRNPDYDKCRPIITIGDDGIPLCEWRR